eukprot:9497087-Heterocapsa_arctica.AAC.1
MGTTDLVARQKSLWMELFAQVATLGNAPWVIGGDWNIQQDQLWLQSIAPRYAGFLPGTADRESTCFPDNGRTQGTLFFLVSHCLKDAVV